jgi:hypothetical protein
MYREQEQNLLAKSTVTVAIRHMAINIMKKVFMIFLLSNSADFAIQWK